MSVRVACCNWMVQSGRCDKICWTAVSGDLIEQSVLFDLPSLVTQNESRGCFTISDPLAWHVICEKMPVAFQVPNRFLCSRPRPSGYLHGFAHRFGESLKWSDPVLVSHAWMGWVTKKPDTSACMCCELPSSSPEILTSLPEDASGAPRMGLHEANVLRKLFCLATRVFWVTIRPIAGNRFQQKQTKCSRQWAFVVLMKDMRKRWKLISQLIQSRIYLVLKSSCSLVLPVSVFFWMQELP